MKMQMLEELAYEFYPQQPGNSDTRNLLVRYILQELHNSKEGMNHSEVFEITKNHSEIRVHFTWSFIVALDLTS